ncbi:MAG: hypothetical protein L3J96_05225, partial [Thermoplasmata archaeon]|nr:hypothetical protein [Thermoplasmata archaeon]
TVDGHEFGLPETLEHLHVERWSAHSRHALGPVEVIQEIFPLHGAPGIARQLTFRSLDGVGHPLSIASEFQPFLAPVLLEGVKPYVYRMEGALGKFQLTSFGSGVSLESSAAPSRVWIDDVPWTGALIEGEIRSIRLAHDLPIAPLGSTEISWVMLGGLARTLGRGSAQEHATSEALTIDRSAVDGDWRKWLAETPVLRLPQAPELEQAYRLARSALRALYSEPEEGLTGLVAGYPWYSSMWCRDLAWMLPAVLWLGDHDWVERSVRSVLRFQARSALPILGGEPGELPMQISPGPIFLFGTSDTSLYYPVLTRQLIDHARRPELAREFLPALARIGEWADHRASTPTGLFRNGGEIEEVRAASAGVGRITYGFDAVDTTIWDSTDRRDHAIDIQVLYTRALTAIAELMERAGTADSRGRLRERANSVAASIPDRYWWPEEGYLYDSLRLDGSSVPRVRPNALAAVAAGLLPRDRALSVLARSLEPDLATPWGLRTLSTDDPGFVPTAYHDGQVWTIATAWAARAAFALRDSVTGVAMLGTIAQRIIEERGFANECYRGDRPEAFNSCFLLGFSVAPFLTCLFEGLWGIHVGPAGAWVSVEPNFPIKWSEADLTGVKNPLSSRRAGRACWSPPRRQRTHNPQTYAASRWAMPCRSLACERRTARWKPSGGSASTSPRARCSPSSDPMARARRRPSRSSRDYAG